MSEVLRLLLDDGWYLHTTLVATRETPEQRNSPSGTQANFLSRGHGYKYRIDTASQQVALTRRNPITMRAIRDLNASIALDPLFPAGYYLLGLG